MARTGLSKRVAEEIRNQALQSFALDEAAEGLTGFAAERMKAAGEWSRDTLWGLVFNLTDDQALADELVYGLRVDAAN